MRIAFLHGWSGDARLWGQVIPLLPEHDCIADDRGYFGTPQEVGSADLVVAHSFGTMRALARRPEGVKALVAINGFDRFAATPDFPGIPPRVLERMEARFAIDPLDTVTAFRARCGALPPDRPLDRHPLAADLAELRRNDCRAHWAGPLLVIHGTDDPIVPPAMQGAVFADRPDARRITLPGHGHLVPLTAARSCADAIRAMIAGLS